MEASVLFRWGDEVRRVMVGNRPSLSVPGCMTWLQVQVALSVQYIDKNKALQEMVQVRALKGLHYVA